MLFTLLSQKLIQTNPARIGSIQSHIVENTEDHGTDDGGKDGKYLTDDAEYKSCHPFVCFVFPDTENNADN